MVPEVVDQGGQLVFDGYVGRKRWIFTLPPWHQFFWGVLGAVAAELFAIWMFLFPDSIPWLFAWDVHPRLAQVFIGAGYIFRTAFFFSIAITPDWRRLRWILYGNLAFTGTLLFATYWSMGEFHWNPHQTIWAHIWLILYIFEPVTMLYMIPKGVRSLAAPTTGGPLHWFSRGFLILVTGALLTNGLMLIINPLFPDNPMFAQPRWPWPLNELDARIIAAWFMGWAVWLATMAFADDWDEIRLPAALFVLNGVALLGTAMLFGGQFREGHAAQGYEFILILMTIGMLVVILLQEFLRRRRRDSGA
jgi:hypothetical protein